MQPHRIFKMSFASVYPHYIAKAEKKGRTKAEADTIICWLTGYTKTQLEEIIVQIIHFDLDYVTPPKVGVTN
ncbi:DUF2200 family protein [Flavobacterium columnare]|nr:DUF2200 family protein [Flavobacterium columnare]